MYFVVALKTMVPSDEKQPWEMVDPREGCADGDWMAVVAAVAAVSAVVGVAARTGDAAATTAARIVVNLILTDVVVFGLVGWLVRIFRKWSARS